MTATVERDKTSDRLIAVFIDPGTSALKFAADGATFHLPGQAPASSGLIPSVLGRYRTSTLSGETLFTFQVDGYPKLVAGVGAEVKEFGRIANSGKTGTNTLLLTLSVLSTLSVQGRWDKDLHVELGFGLPQHLINTAGNRSGLPHWEDLRRLFEEEDGTPRTFEVTNERGTRMITTSIARRLFGGEATLAIKPETWFAWVRAAYVEKLFPANSTVGVVEAGNRDVQIAGFTVSSYGKPLYLPFEDKLPIDMGTITIVESVASQLRDKVNPRITNDEIFRAFVAYATNGVSSLEVFTANGSTTIDIRKYFQPEITGFRWQILEEISNRLVGLPLQHMVFSGGSAELIKGEIKESWEPHFLPNGRMSVAMGGLEFMNRFPLAPTFRAAGASATL
ncbi:hypothetical protein [Leptolyngbya sp. FACHB-261]|uniref:hypothetical protein n=1 Tax=Leptolyngbya sp. FACHB-261 TaxID=2692806 RepID=UPI0016893EAC|nr:hypothetical protein [Leptolyngbya sp. FACHB-261]MBD2102454.1 hypothetical protein [Leptolyngbya sp. FACHB-261]